MNKETDSVELAFWNLDNCNTYAEANSDGAVYRVPAMPLGHLKNALDAMIGLETMIGYLEPQDTGVLISLHEMDGKTVEIQTCLSSVEEVMNLHLAGDVLYCDGNVQFEWDAEEGVLYIFGSGNVEFEVIQTNLKVAGSMQCTVHHLEGNLEARQNASVLADTIHGKVLAADESQVEVKEYIGKNANSFGDSKITAHEVRGEVVQNNSTYPVQVGGKFEPLHVKGDCDVAGLSEAGRNRLTSVGGELDLYGVSEINLPNLCEVSYLNAENSHKVTLPALKQANIINVERSTSVALPALENGVQINAQGSENLLLPNLIYTLVLDAYQSYNLQAPQLQTVGNSLNLEGAVLANLSAVEEVHGNLCADSVKDVTLEKLRRVGNLLQARGSEDLNLPSLVDVDGQISAQGSKNFTAWNLRNVGVGSIVAPRPEMNDGSHDMNIPYDLAFKHEVPVECLSRESLEKALDDLSQEPKISRTQTKGVK